MKIVDTDNFGNDLSPPETVFLDNIPTRELAERICAAIASRFMHVNDSRWLKVEEDNYKLFPGVEP